MWTTRNEVCMGMIFLPMTSDLGDMTLTLEIMWQLSYPTYRCYIGQFAYVDYQRGVGVHGHVIMPLCLLKLEV